MSLDGHKRRVVLLLSRLCNGELALIGIESLYSYEFLADPAILGSKISTMFGLRAQSKRSVCCRGENEGKWASYLESTDAHDEELVVDAGRVQAQLKDR